MGIWKRDKCGPCVCSSGVERKSQVSAVSITFFIAFVLLFIYVSHASSLASSLFAINVGNTTNMAGSPVDIYVEGPNSTAYTLNIYANQSLILSESAATSSAGRYLHRPNFTIPGRYTANLSEDNFTPSIASAWFDIILSNLSGPYSNESPAIIPSRSGNNTSVGIPSNITLPDSAPVNDSGAVPEEMVNVAGNSSAGEPGDNSSVQVPAAGVAVAALPQYLPNETAADPGMSGNATEDGQPPEDNFTAPVPLEEAPKVRAGLNIIDSDSGALSYTLDILDRSKGNVVKSEKKIGAQKSGGKKDNASSGDPAQTNASESYIPSGVYDAEITFDDASMHIKSMRISGWNITANDTSLGIEELGSPRLVGHKLARVYSIDPSAISFSQAQATVTATGQALYKCKEWNFTTQTCAGAWQKIRSLVPGENYTIILDTSDPGYAEINVTDAIHLTSNYTFISNIYENVRAIDSNWSEPIYSGEIVRATFAQNMTSGNIMNLYLRSGANDSSGTWVEIYSAGDNTTLLGKTSRVSSTGAMHDILLRNMTGSSDTFDLIIKSFSPSPSSYIEFDYIHDGPSDPKYFNNQTNSTLFGSDIKFSLNWTDDVALSGYIFSWYNGSNWTWSGTSLNSTKMTHRASTGGTAVKTGTGATNGVNPLTITFTTAMPSASYSALISGDTDTDTMYSLEYGAKVAASFTANAEDDTGVLEAGNIEWMALEYMDRTFRGYSIKCNVDNTFTGTGTNTINFATAFPNTNYAIVSNSITDTDSPIVNLVSKAAASANLRIEDDTGAAEAISEQVYCAFTFGEYKINGIYIKAGSSTTAAAGDTTVTFANSLPNTNYVVNAMATSVATAHCAPEVVTKNAGSFTIHFEDDVGANCATRAFDWVAITNGEYKIGLVDANSTPVIYDNIYPDSVLKVITNITITVNVSSYNMTASSGLTSSPDLWLEIWDGTSWIGLGNMSVTGAGNFSNSTQNPSIMAAWQNPANRDIRITGRYLDEDILWDEINYTQVWVDVASTGEFKNDTWVSMTGAGNWSNVTKRVNSTIGATIMWRVFANDTSNNVNESEVFSFITADTLFPQYSQNQTNTTEVGMDAKFSLRWTDNVQLYGYIFSFDNGTGTFSNDTFVSMIGILNWSNVTKSINLTFGSQIRWRVFSNDTTGNMNASQIFSFTTTDSVYPLYTQNSSNNTEVGLSTRFSLYWTDNSDLKGYIFSIDNGTGSFSNDTYVLMSGFGNWSNVTKSINLTYGSLIRWRFFANDTAGNMNASQIFSFTTTDSVYPLYTQNSSNNTEVGSSVKFSLYWTDNSALKGYIFSFDNGTGSFSNDTYVLMSGFGNWSNITKSINLTYGSLIRWRIYANDTAGNLNASGIFSFTTTDSQYPRYTLNQTNSTEVGSSVKFSLYWTDNSYLSGYIFSFDNGTGSFSNDTFTSFSATPGWSNVTKTINSTLGSQIRWRVYANDTAGSLNASAVFSFATTDTEAPGHSLNQTNSTEAGRRVIFSLYWTENIALSGYIFSIDNGTGAFANDTFVSMTGVGNWSNSTKTVNSTIGTLIRWRFFANDTSGNMNASTIFSFLTTVPEDPPVITLLSPASGNYSSNTNVSLVFRYESQYSAANCSAYTNKTGAWSIYSTDYYNSTGYINASSLTIVTGSIESGTLSDTWVDDGVDFILNEDAATPPFNYIFNFTPSYTFNRSAALNINISGHYATSASSHVVNLSAYNYNTSQWDYLRRIDPSTSEIWYNYSIPNAMNYSYPGQNIQLRFYHVSGSVTTHNLYIDYMTVSGMTLNITNTTNIDFQSSGEYIWNIVCYDTRGKKGTFASNRTIYIDLAAPLYSLNQTDKKEIGASALFSLYWTDSFSLSGYIFSFDNGTGSFSNDTFVSMTGTGNWSNVTKNLNTTVDSLIRWRVYANDTAGSLNASDVFSFYTTEIQPPEITIVSPSNTTYASSTIWFNTTLNKVGPWCGYSLDGSPNVTMSQASPSHFYWQASVSEGSHKADFFCNETTGLMANKSVYFTVDMTVPKYSLNQTNSTQSGTDIRFSLFWTDNLNLDGYIFSWNNGANWTGVRESGDIESGTRTETATATEFGYSYPDNFESGWGNWSNLTSGDSSDWIRDSGGTPTSGTGPCNGGSGSNCGAENSVWYLFVETSSGYCNLGGDTAVVWMSKEIDFDSGSGDQISWWNNMYGSNIGTLYLQENTTGAWSTLWTMSGDQGAAWFRNTTDLSSLEGRGYLRFRYICGGGGLGDIAIDQITINSSALADTELNKTAVYYSNFYTAAINEPLNNITVTVGVTSYNKSGSVAKGNNNPDLWLGIYEGANWIGIGNFTVSATGSYTLSTENPAILSAWQQASSREIRIKGAYFDYYDAGNFDSISWDSVQVSINTTAGSLEFMNDSYAYISGVSAWSNVTKRINSTAGATIKWRVYGFDTAGNMNASDIYTLTGIDTLPPSYSSNRTNTTYAGQDILFSLYWTDNSYLSGYIFSFDNGTGTFSNDTFAAFSATSGWSNVTKSANYTIGTIIRWRVYSNDTSGNANASEIFTLNTTDGTPPLWRNQGSNATTISYTGSVKLYAEALDNSALRYAVLSTDENGAWQNKTGVYSSPMNLGSVKDTWTWSNFTWQNTSVFNRYVSWRIWYNDSSGYWSSTDTMSFYVKNSTKTYYNATLYVYDTNSNTAYADDSTKFTVPSPSTNPANGSTVYLGNIGTIFNYSTYVVEVRLTADKNYSLDADYFGETYFFATAPFNLTDTSSRKELLLKTSYAVDDLPKVEDVYVSTSRHADYGTDAGVGEAGFISGDVDVVAGTQASTEVMWYKNTNDGASWSTNTVDTAGLNARSVALGDIDSDGDIDVVYGDENQDVILLKNTGNGTFGTRTVIESSAGDNVYTVALGDIDSDGDLDVLYGTGPDTRNIYSRLNSNGLGTSWSSRTTVNSPGGAVNQIALGDLDGDGDLDAVSANNNGYLYRHMNTNGLGTSWTTGNIVSGLVNALSVALADIDGDGDLDVISGDSNQRVYVYINDGTGTGWSQYTVDSSSGGSVYSVAAGDVDGDGHVDVIYGTSGLKVYWRSNLNGLGTSWSSRNTILSSSSGTIYSLAVADIDSDGDMDVISGDSTGNIWWYNNTGSYASAWSSTNVYTGSTVYSVAVGDIDRDSNSNRLELYYNSSESTESGVSEFTGWQTLENGTAYSFYFIFQPDKDWVNGDTANMTFYLGNDTTGLWSLPEAKTFGASITPIKLKWTLGINTTDKDPPKWRSQGSNDTTPLSAGWALLYAEATDNNAVDSAILSTNESGVWQNKTGVYSSPYDMGNPSTWTWSNFTWQNTSVEQAAAVGWRIWYNDTAGNWNVTDIATFTIRDTTPPLWDSQGENVSSSVAGNHILLSARSYDNGNLGYAVLETNESGAWENKSGAYSSPLNLGGAKKTWTWSNFTWFNSSVEQGTTIGWRIWYNDTFGNLNTTGILTFTINDTTSPQSRSQSSNESGINPGDAVILSSESYDNVALAYAVLETNETGAWQNKSGFYSSPLSLGGAKKTWTWSNITWLNASVISGTTVGWRVWYNDTTGNLNSTSVQSFLVNDTISPTITLISPPSGAIDSDGNLTFVFLPDDRSQIHTCALYTNTTGIWQLNKTNTSVMTKGQNNMIAFNVSADGTYAWNIFCNDTNGNGAFASSNYTFSVIMKKTYMQVFTPNYDTIARNHTNNASYAKFDYPSNATMGRTNITEELHPIQNGGFDTDLSSWTGVVTGGTYYTVWDSAGYTTGDLQEHVGTGAIISGTGYRWQAFTVNALPVNATLKFRWAKSWAAIAAARQRMYVDIVQPDTTVVTVWSDLTIVQVKSWTLVTLNIRPQLTTTGTYNIRLRGDVRTGNNAAAQSNIFFDDVDINLSRSVYAIDRYYANFDISSIPDGVTIFDSTLSSYVNGGVASSSLNISHANETYGVPTPAFDIFNYSSPSEETETNPVRSISSAAVGEKNVTVRTSVNETYLARKDTIAFFWNETGEDHYASIDGSSGVNMSKLYIEYSDTSPPRYSSQGENSTSIPEGGHVKVYAYWIDNYQLNTRILSTNKTGAWINETPETISGTSAWTNFTIDTAGYPNTTIGWRIYVQDNSENLNFTPTMTFYVSDSKAPVWSLNRTSPASGSTYAPAAGYQFNLTWTDDVRVDKVIFEWNTTANYTVSGKVGNEYYINMTDLAAGNYTYRWYANDTTNNWNITSAWPYEVKKAALSVTLLLNRTSADRSYNYSSHANFTTYTSIQGRNLELWTNLPGLYQQWKTGAEPLVNITNLTYSLGTYQVTGNFTGDTNYTSATSMHYLTIIDTVAPFFSRLSSTSPRVNKGNAINLSAYWTDNYLLSYAVLETNETTVWQNSTLSSPYAFASSAEYSNFTITGPSSMIPGILGWRIYANDTSGNTNVTTPVQSVELWGWAEVTGESVDPATILTGENTTIRCRVIDNYTGQPVSGYAVSFYNASDYYIGTDSTLSTGWAEIQYNDSTANIETLKCNISGYSAKYYNASYDNTGTASLTTNTPGISPIHLYPDLNGFEIYNLNATRVQKGAHVLMYARWNGTIASALAKYNTTQSGIDTVNADTIDPVYNWTNHTMATNISWYAGVHSAKITITGTNTYINDTLPYLAYEVWGWSNITWVSPSGKQDRGPTTLKCNVTDANTTGPVQNYNVTFYCPIHGYVGDALTDSSGISSIVAGTTEHDVGPVTMKCNITDSTDTYYNKTTTFEAESTIIIFGTLSTTIINPANETSFHRGDTVNLNSTTIDDNLALTVPDNSSWFNTTSLLNPVQSENYTWQIPFGHELGPELITLNTTKQYHNNDTQNITIYIWGWSKINSSSISPSNINQDTSTTAYCRITDANTTLGIQNYPVEFNNSAGLLGDNVTNSTGWARYTFTDSTPGIENITCTIRDNSTLWYNITSVSSANMTLSTNDTAIPRYFDISINVTGAVHKGDDLLLSAYWTDNYNLNKAVLETNETGAFLNSTLASPIQMTGTGYWSNFTITVPSSMTPGTLSWRIYGNDTTGNLNVTSPLQNITVWGWADTEVSSLTPSSITAGESVTMSCLVEDENSRLTISNYTVSFYNSTAYLGTNTTGADGWAYWTFADYSTGIEEIKCNITDNETLMYNVTAPFELTEYLSTQSSGAPEIYRVLTNPMDDGAPARSGIIIYNPNPNVTTITNLRDIWSVDRVNNFNKCCTPGGCAESAGSSPLGNCTESSNGVVNFTGGPWNISARSYLVFWYESVTGGASALTKTANLTTVQYGNQLRVDSDPVTGARASAWTSWNSTSGFDVDYDAVASGTPKIHIVDVNKTTPYIIRLRELGGSRGLSANAFINITLPYGWDNSTMESRCGRVSDRVRCNLTSALNNGADSFAINLTSPNTIGRYVLVTEVQGPDTGGFLRVDRNEHVILVKDLTTQWVSSYYPPDGYIHHKNDSVTLSVLWGDNYQLYQSVLETNESGVFENKTGVYDSPVSMSGKSYYSNFTWQNITQFTGKMTWRVYSNDSSYNSNMTEHWIDIWGWSQILGMSPPNSTYFRSAETLPVKCMVTDRETGQPITDYPVDFWNTTETAGTYLGTSYTDASGYAQYGWWTDDLHTGKYYEICNITSNSTLKYNVSGATGIAYYTIVNSKDPDHVHVSTYQDNFAKEIRFFDKTNETLRDTVYVEAKVMNYWDEEIAGMTTGASTYNATVYSGGSGDWNYVGNITLENVFFGTYRGNITLDPSNTNGYYKIHINASNDYGWANGSIMFHVYQGNGTSAYPLPFDSDSDDDYVLENRRMIAVYSGKENNTAPLLYVYQKEAEAEYNLSDIRQSEQDSIIGGISTENLTYARFRDISLKYTGEDIGNSTINMRVSMAKSPRNSELPLVYRLSSDPQAVNGYVNNTIVVFNNNTAPLTVSEVRDSHTVLDSSTDVISENESCSPSCYEVTSPYNGINFTGMPMTIEGHSYAVFTYRFKPNVTTLSPSSSTVNPTAARNYIWSADSFTQSDSSSSTNSNIYSTVTDNSDSTFSTITRRPTVPEVRAVVSNRSVNPNDYYKVGLRVKVRNSNSASGVNYNVRVYSYQSDGNNVYTTSYVEQAITTSGTFTWYSFDITDLVKSSGYSNIRTRFLTTENTDTISGGTLRVSEVRYNLTTLDKASYDANATVVSDLGTVSSMRSFDINLTLDPAVAYVKISKDNATFSDAIGPIVGNTNQTFYMRIYEIANTGTLLAGKNVTVSVPSSWQVGQAGCRNTSITGNTINYTIASNIKNSYETFCFWAVAPNVSAGYVFMANVTGKDSIWQDHKDTFEILATTEPEPVTFNMSVTMRTDEVDYLVYKIFNFNRNITRLNRLWSDLPGNFSAADRYHAGDGSDGLVSSLASGWTTYSPAANKYAALYAPVSRYSSNLTIGWIYFNSTNNISSKDLGVYKGSESVRVRFNATNATANDSIEYLLAFPFDDPTVADLKMPEILNQQYPVMIAIPDPNITAIRIYDVTGSGIDYKIDLSNLVGSGINNTFRLFARHKYRIEVDAQNPLQSTWLVATSNTSHQYLNSSWTLNAPTDIWYILKSKTYDGGTWSSGNVTWNTSLGGRLTPSDTMTFYYVLDLTNSRTEVRQVHFLIKDPYASYQDYSTYNITRIGYINATLILPPDNTIVPWQRNFTIKINATCYDGDCWTVQARTRYNQSSRYPDTDISSAVGATPFYIRAGDANPKDCGYMLGGATCTINYTVNATGALRSNYEIGAVFNTSLNVTNVTTSNSTIEIGKILIMSLGFTDIDFGAGDPGSTISAKNNTDQLYNITLDPNSNSADGGLWIKGENLTGVGSYEVNASKIHWNSTTHSAYEILTHDYQNIQASMSSGTNTTTYYWVDVPLRTMLGTYTGKIYFMVNDSW